MCNHHRHRWQFLCRWGSFCERNYQKYTMCLITVLQNETKTCSAGADLKTWIVPVTYSDLTGSEPWNFSFQCFSPLCSIMKGCFWNVPQCTCWNYKHCVEWQQWAESEEPESAWNWYSTSMSSDFIFGKLWFFLWSPINFPLILSILFIDVITTQVNRGLFWDALWNGPSHTFNVPSVVFVQA